MSDAKISQKELAQMAGISSVALSEFLSETYEGRMDNIVKKLLRVLEKAKNRQIATLIIKKPEIIETSIMSEITAGLDYTSAWNDVLIIYR